MQRREFLAVAGAVSVWFAGCISSDDTGADGTDTNEPATETATRTSTATEHPTSTTTTTASETNTIETDTTTTTETTSEPPSPTATPTTATATETDAGTTDATTRSNPQPSDDGTTDGTITVSNRTFAVGSGTAGGSDAPGGATGIEGIGGDEASVAFDAAANRIVVTGTIVGENGCRTAVLDGTSYDADAGLLTVTVGTERDAPEDAACSLALVELPYEATITFEGGLPERVSVVHRGVETDGEVTTATRES